MRSPRVQSLIVPTLLGMSVAALLALLWVPQLFLIRSTNGKESAVRTNIRNGGIQPLLLTTSATSKDQSNSKAATLNPSPYGCTEVNQQDLSAIPLSNALKEEQHFEPKLCNLQHLNGPLPVVLMSSGRSGSSSTWQILSTLTGQETASLEYSGSNEKANREFFATHQDAAWLEGLFCEQKKSSPQAGMVGTKWKPGSIDVLFGMQGALETLLWMRHNSESVKLVRSVRNALDVHISGVKHKSDGTKPKVQSHCRSFIATVQKEACLKHHLVAGTNITLETQGLVNGLRKFIQMEEGVNRLLAALKIPFVSVTYEGLYYPQDGSASSWMRIFDFLGIGPRTNLTMQDVKGAMTHMPTHNDFHNVTLANYEEVRSVLENANLGHLLH